MNNPDPNQWHNPPQAASRRRLPTVAIIVTVIVVVAALIAGGLYLWRASTVQDEAAGEPEPMSELILERATPTTREPTEDTSTVETTSEDTTRTDTETVTVAESEPEPESAQREPEGASESNATPRSGGAASVACDGRGVLIIESVVDDGTIDARARIEQVISQNPGAVYFNPGICPSLRGQVDGHDIYPVAIDYGQNHDALCNAWRQRGGDPRYLNTDNDYTSPC